MKVEILTPEQVISFEDIVSISFETPEGEIGIMHGHENMITMLNPGIIVVQQNDKKIEYFVTSGFVEIISEKTTLIVEEIFERSSLNNEILKIKELEFNALSDTHPDYKEKSLVIESLKTILS